MGKPKVSVCVVTYNQKNYIRECLQSLVSQETIFPFEIIVGDDASTDGTAEIVREFANQHPNLIKIVLHKENCGFSKNYFSVHNMAEGEYIAHLDGDDFALVGKLQMQADFLDKHLDCMIVGHSMIYLDDLGNQKVKKKNCPLIADSQYYLKNFGYFAHSSKMYRSEKRSYEYFRDKEVVLDCHLNLFHSLNGKIGYIPEILGVYRCGVGISSDNYELCQNWALKTFQYALDWEIDKKFVLKCYSKFYMQIIYHNLLRQDFRRFQDNENSISLIYRHRVIFLIIKKNLKLFSHLFKLMKFFKSQLMNNETSETR